MVLFSISNILKNMFKTSSLDIGVEEFKEKLEQERGVIIDVRTKEEFEAGHLKLTDDQKDFLNGDFHDNVKFLDKSKTYYLYCRSGNRSGKAAQMLEQEGFKKVYNVGGYDDLVSAGFESKK